MKEWKDIQKKYIAIELIGIASIIICFMVGVWCDWVVIVEDSILITIEDIQSFSLTILQIQATIGTLIVAIIALITGNISDSYMGVSVSDFYLNIKPWKLKQKTLIFISLGLCLLGVIAHSLKLYNVVFYLFIATLIAIATSIIEIYSAFRGKNTENLEIEAYINYILESDAEFSKKENIYKNFVLDWKKVVVSQDKQSYEKYFGVFEKCMLVAWDYETDKGLMSIQQQCYSMAYCLLGSEKNATKERGIEFVQNVYDVLWRAIYKGISEKKTVSNKYKNGFFFFTEICSELIQSMDDLNVESVEKKIKFDNLSDSIQRIAIWLRYDVDKDNCSEQESEDSGKSRTNYDNEMSELNYFSRYLGHYLEKQKNKGNIINQNIWANALNRWSIFSTYNIPEDRCEDFLKAKAFAYFNYWYGMLLNGQENIVKQGLYLMGIKNTVKLDNKYQALMYLAVHCYVYYLAERESADCVHENIRKVSKNILNDEKVKIVFGSFLDMLAENIEWLDLDMHEQICKMLDRYELFPIYENVKTMIMDSVVSDFYMFLVLFMSHEYFLPELLEKNIDDMEAFRYVTDGNEEKTKEMLKSLFKIVFIGCKSEEQTDVEVGLMYDNLKKTVKRKQKQRYINLARDEQKKYINNIKEEEICQKIRIETIRKIKEKFSSIIIDEDKKNGLIRVNLLTLNDYTSSLQSKKLDGYYSHIDGMFLLGIINFLYSRRVVEKKNRFDDFSNDKEFMEYLEANDLKLLLGSQFILKNTDYKFTAEYNKFLEDYKTIYTAVVNAGMALKKDAVRVCLHDVKVSIHSPSIKEEKIGYDKLTGKYNYSIMNGLPIDFEEGELREFLYNNRKIINVTAKISIKVNEKPVGTLITGRKKGEFVL